MTTSNTPAVAQARFNTLSIVAIIGAFVVPLIGSIIGFVALGQIKRTGERGHGLALAAVVLGIVFTVLYIAIAVLTAVVSASVSVSGY